MTDQTQPRCTCARAWNLHSRDCARYVEGHELAAGIRDAARQASGQQPDTCRTADIDGTPVHVRGAGDWTDEDQRHMEAIVRAAKRKADAAPAAGLSDTQPTVDEAHPPREQWVIEWYREAKGEWLEDQPAYNHHEDAVDEIARARRHEPARQRRLVRETTTWTVEEDETR